MFFTPTIDRSGYRGLKLYGERFRSVRGNQCAFKNSLCTFKICGNVLSSSPSFRNAARELLSRAAAVWVRSTEMIQLEGCHLNREKSSEEGGRG